MGNRFYTLTYEYPERGYHLILFEEYMMVGQISEKLAIEPRDAPFGTHLFRAGQSHVRQIGDGEGSSIRRMMFKFRDDDSTMLYLGVLRSDTGEMLIFEPYEKGEPKRYQRNLFGNIIGLPYRNLYVAFNNIGGEELHITTVNLVPRIFSPTVIFAE